jgi:hypothetical protein
MSEAIRGWVVSLCRVQVIRLSLCDIHAADGSGRLLGGLVYADTFVALQGQPLVLTDTVPPLLSWGAAGLEDRLASRIDRAMAKVYIHQGARCRASCRGSHKGEYVWLREAAFPRTQIGRRPPSHAEATTVEASQVVEQALGAPLQDAPEEVLLCMSCSALPVVVGQWHTFTGGLVFTSAHTAPLVLHFAAMVENVALMPGVADSPTRLIVDCNTRPTCGPLEVLAPEWRRLVFSLAPMRLSAQRHFHRAVLPEWEVTLRVLGLPFATDGTADAQVSPEAVPPSLAAQHAFAESQFSREKRMPLTWPDADVLDCLQRMDAAEAARDSSCHPVLQGTHTACEPVPVLGLIWVLRLRLDSAPWCAPALCAE